MCKNLIFSSLVLFSLVVLQSCREEFIPADEANLELDFYPVDSLTTWEFVMDSVIYDNEGLVIDSSSSFLREQIVSKTFDENGIPVYKIEVARKSDFFDQYFVTDIWTLRIENNSIIRNEENLNFVKLKMPPVLGANWDGTPFPEDVEVYVAGDPIEMYLYWDSKFADRFVDVTFSGVEYDNVLHVIHADSENRVEKRFASEYYAKGIGLIRRELEIYDTQCFLPDCDETQAWEDKAEQGFKLVQKLIDYY